MNRLLSMGLFLTASVSICLPFAIPSAGLSSIGLMGVGMGLADKVYR